MSAPLANGNAPVAMAGTTGRRVLTLDRLGPSDVPTHPDLKDAQANAPALKDFIQGCYAEAVTELGKLRKGIGEAKDKVGGVGVVVKKWKTEDDGLTWFGRTSEHEEGCPVSFEGLNGCLMKEHEAHEAEYTPGLYDVNSLLEWECGGLEVDVGEGVVLRDLEMRITQMHHTLPSLLSDRCFSVLLLAFSTTPTQSLNMQIPINVPSFPAPIKSRSHLRLAQNSSTKYIYHNDSPDATPTQAQKTKSQKEVVQGSYVSVERIRLVEREGMAKGVIEWDMKTAGDAGGKLPAWAQKMGMPGAIVKDVPLALKFIMTGRDG